MAISIEWQDRFDCKGGSVARTTDARERAIETAEQLFRVQGYAATGLNQIIEESGAPKGSFYFHFPGGKRELAAEVLAGYRAKTSAGFRMLAEKAAGDSNRFVRALVKTTAEGMKASDWAAGCVAQVLAQELAPGDAEMSDALASLFDEWVEIAAAAIGPLADRRSARARALALVAALEGARTLARTLRSVAPFDAVARQFVTVQSA
ncbi:TetR/AcrR family transcriptional regulator [Sphingobium sp. AS12]|uniref:TetR/AcrR family transcriptional regulator n=1 Tax=Sphingobium sp. AS12 TaxID=2849495 RepID=UPI001C311E5F|nr:TetR/AcrR family transcriptional regulator [Sphingobium sp. AS12]MBV2150125.1 TetR/AcrR family transcriptional regulator [Sphingobium sp. AS12]